MNEYPSFDPPLVMSPELPPSDWSRTQVTAYATWLKANFERRAGILEEYFGAEGAERPVEAAAAAIARDITKPPFMLETDEGPQLQPKGLSVSIDLGLLMARELIQQRPSLCWHVCRQRKDPSFNLPVLKGFPNYPKMQFNPFMIGGTCIAHMIDDGTSDKTKGIFQYWMDC